MSAALKSIVKSIRRRLVCRLPILALWSLVALVALYKLNQNSTTVDPQTSSLQVPTSALHYQPQFPTPPTPNFNTKLVNLDNDDYKQHVSTIQGDDNDGGGGSTQSSTRKAPRQYRQGKVFILLVQNEFTRSPRPSQTHFPIESSVRSQITPNRRHNTYNNFIPAHIQVVVEVLEAHKIEFLIDTTRDGVPQSLLDEQGSNSNRHNSESKHFSVIVIDDLVRYTRLSHWTRDQLDRLCRYNRIGVVGFFNDHNDDFFSSSSPLPSNGTFLLDQMPLSIRPVQHSCRGDKRSSSKQQQQQQCLVDYELNDKSPILRLIKSRPNYVLNGPLVDNLNKAAWISMASNHKTFEPLTFARMRIFNKDSSTDKTTNISLNNNKSETLYVSLSSDDVPADLMESEAKDRALNELLAGDASSTSGTTSFETETAATATQATGYSVSSERLVMSMVDKGAYDGIKRVIFGAGAHFWLHRALLLDAIEHLSGGAILSPLDRFIQIDIDDMFVAESGKRMTKADVDALLETQRQFAARIEGGFQFNLGYSGKYFRHGSREENEGDEELVRQARHFTWFCHTWSHSKAHLENDMQAIKDELVKNRKFALEHNLPLIGEPQNWRIRQRRNGSATTVAPLPPFATYAVAPHHAGVYPIHEKLYEAWREIINVQVTSTEEYPTLKPARVRKGFVHNKIKVLPRQTCGLYTHTVLKTKYPGGFARLNSIIEGGELFETLLHNPVNIYMSHMTNYASDRLAPLAFNKLFDFVQNFTNLQIRFQRSSNGSLGPESLAQYYFELNPSQIAPLWTNPCADKRHLEIWAPKKHSLCKKAPNLLIVGPQKTGTTALLTFIKINTIFESSQVDAQADFEEVQFFNNKHYFKGIDWYLSRFDNNRGDSGRRNEKTNSTNSYESNNNNNDDDHHEPFIIDKSATYFDDPLVPQRARALLPNVQVLISLVDPVERAYSWYHHVKAHNDSTATSYSFEKVLASSSNGAEYDDGDGGDDQEVVNTDDHSLVALRSRCLEPGHYAQHLARWLRFFAAQQIIIVDGQWFKRQPAAALNKLQQLLLRHRNNYQKTLIDYSKHLVFDSRKRFYCRLEQTSGAHKCLGPSKGRQYPPMSSSARAYLQRYYKPHNAQLAQILYDKLGQPLPEWLDKAIGMSAVAY